MIGSVTELQSQMAALARRQQAAGQPVVAPATVAVPPPVLAVPAVAKAAAPDLAKPGSGAGDAAGKPRKGKRGKRGERERLHRPECVTEPETPATAAHAAAVAGHNSLMAERDAAEHGDTAGREESAAKALTGAHGTPGPDHPMQPGQAEPQQFAHPYLSQGHAAPSPQAEPPMAPPIHHAPNGVLQPIALPGAVRAAYVPAHVTAALTGGSPSDR